MRQGSSYLRPSPAVPDDFFSKFGGPVDVTVPGIESGGDIRSSYE
jgi:hypothetical protein